MNRSQVGPLGGEVQLPVEQPCGTRRTVATGRYGRADSEDRSASSASPCNRSRSRATLASIPVRITLTTICRPSCSRPACTWPIDADAIGTGSNSREQVLGRLAQLVGDGLADDVGGVGRGVGLELGQLVGQGRADDVRAGAEDLAELDERGPQVGQGETDAGLVRPLAIRWNPVGVRWRRNQSRWRKPPIQSASPYSARMPTISASRRAFCSVRSQAVEEHAVRVAGARRGRYTAAGTAVRKSGLCPVTLERMPMRKAIGLDRPGVGPGVVAAPGLRPSTPRTRRRPRSRRTRRTRRAPHRDGRDGRDLSGEGRGPVPV